MFLLVGEILLDSDFKILLNKFSYKKIKNLDELNYINLNTIEYIVSRGAHFLYSKDILKKFTNLKGIYLFQIGTDNIDIDYCLKKGIEVKNFVSEKSVYSVAELTLGGLIMGLRQATNLGYKLKKGKYIKKPLGFNLEGKKIGVMGAGRIGSKVVDLLKNFPVNIGVYDIIFKNEKFLNIKSKFESSGVKTFSELDVFLDYSDYITIHIPGLENNLGLLTYDKLKKIKGLVNMSRAGIVVEEDLLKLLNEGKLDFYISDVVEGEPNINLINRDLLNHEKVFIMPHIGSNTYEVQEDIINKFLFFFNKKCQRKF